MIMITKRHCFTFVSTLTEGEIHLMNQAYSYTKWTTKKHTLKKWMDGLLQAIQQHLKSILHWAPKLGCIAWPLPVTCFPGAGIFNHFYLFWKAHQRRHRSSIHRFLPQMLTIAGVVPGWRASKSMLVPHTGGRDPSTSAISCLPGCRFSGSRIRGLARHESQNPDVEYRDPKWQRFATIPNTCQNIPLGKIQSQQAGQQPALSLAPRKRKTKFQHTFGLTTRLKDKNTNSRCGKLRFFIFHLPDNHSLTNRGICRIMQ